MCGQKNKSICKPHNGAPSQISKLFNPTYVNLTHLFVLLKSVQSLLAYLVAKKEIFSCHNDVLREIAK